MKKRHTILQRPDDKPGFTLEYDSICREWCYIAIPSTEPTELELAEKALLALIRDEYESGRWS